MPLSCGCAKSTVVPLEPPLELLPDPPLELLLELLLDAPLEPPLEPPLDVPLDPDALTVPPELLAEATVVELAPVEFPQPASASVSTKVPRAQSKYRLHFSQFISHRLAISSTGV